MKVDAVKNNLVFKSGYPTFRTGHLGVKALPEGVLEHVYIGYKPVDILKGKKLDYLA